MKLKNLSLVAGAIVLTLTATSFATKAEISSSSPFMIAQAQELPRKFQGLGLTDAQQAQISEIFRNGRAQIEAVLTPEQQQQLQAATQSGQKRGGFRSLNLTEQQRTQIREIKQSQKSQIEAVLTPSQREQLQQMRQNWRNNRQQPNQQSSQS